MSVTVLVWDYEISCLANEAGPFSALEVCVRFFRHFIGGQFGRLGHGDEYMQNQPRLVETLTKHAPFESVACGSAHTLVVSESK